MTEERPAREQSAEQNCEQNLEQNDRANRANGNAEQAENELYKNKSKNKSIPKTYQVDTGRDVENLPDCGKTCGKPPLPREADDPRKTALCPLCLRPVVPVGEMVKSPKNPAKLACRRCRRTFWRAECVKSERGGAE